MRIITAFILAFAGLASHTQDIVKYISNSVGLITYFDQASKSLSYGTASLVARPISSNQAQVFIITCLHELPNRNQSSTVEFKIKKSVGDTNTYTTLAVRIFDKLGLYSRNVIVDPLYDVAAINISEYYYSAGLSYLTDYLLPYQLLLNKDSIRKQNIQVGFDIDFIGYPSLFYDQRNISPIVRTGIIATPPDEDFYFNDYLKQAYLTKFKQTLPDSFNGFLIDANAFGGSSGSLVFLKPEASRITAGGGVVFGGGSTTPFILGILDSSYFDIDEHGPFQRLNLGAVISSEHIINLIDRFK